MNKRQWKKRYKRIHGDNPPKFYRKAQIRRGCKLNLIQNFIYKGGNTLYYVIEQAIAEIQRFGKILSEKN